VAPESCGGNAPRAPSSKPVSVPVSVSVPDGSPAAVFDRSHVFSIVRPSERKHSSVDPTSPTARLRRAGGPSPCHPERATCHGEAVGRSRKRVDGPPEARELATSTHFPRADPGPGGRVSLVGCVEMTTRSISPCLCRSSRPQVQSRRDTKSPPSLRFREARSRRWSLEVGVAPAAPASFARALSLSGFCCGPRYASIWRPQADAISRRLPALATKPFTPAGADRFFVRRGAEG